MEKELNIAAILKDKPKGTKLWSPIFGECIFDEISCDNSAIGVNTHKSVPEIFYANGKYDENGECTIFPSKQMRDWSKFAWKKGDVLINGCGFQCIFKEWASDDYTKFNGCYSNSRDGYEDVQSAVTMKFQKIDNNIAYGYIREIEKELGGKFNLETLQIEKPKQEFKDGDIVTFGGSVAICKKIRKDILYFYACIDDSWGLLLSDSVDTSLEYRLATDSEKQQLFDALAKEGKVWNSETKQIEDLPKKCEFKQMDLCLMSEGYDESLWNLCQFAFKDVEGFYYSIGGGIWRECIPYNDSTKHLLGTTDEWKGGEG